MNWNDSQLNTSYLCAQQKTKKCCKKQEQQNNKHQQQQKSPPVPLWTLEFSRGIKLAQGQNSRTLQETIQNVQFGL